MTSCGTSTAIAKYYNLVYVSVFKETVCLPCIYLCQASSWQRMCHLSVWWLLSVHKIMSSFRYERFYCWEYNLKKCKYSVWAEILRMAIFRRKANMKKNFVSYCDFWEKKNTLWILSFIYDYAIEQNDIHAHEMLKKIWFWFKTSFHLLFLLLLERKVKGILL